MEQIGVALSVTSLSTDGIPAALRMSYWSDTVESLFDLKVDPFGAKTLDGHIDYFKLSRLQLYRIEGSRNRVALPAGPARRSAQPVVKVQFQVSGTSHFEEDGQKLLLRPGDCLVHDMARPHRITTPSLTKLHMVVIPKEIGRRSAVLSGPMTAKKLARDSTTQIAHDLLETILKMASTLPPDAAGGMSDALLKLLLLPLSRQTAAPARLTNSDTLRQRARAFIEDNLSDPELSIDQISEAVGCTKRYLHMMFREEGTTVGRHIWQLRIERCRHELERAPFDDRSITDIAFSWGFSSCSHFSRLFKSRFGFAPSALRRRGSVI